MRNDNPKLSRRIAAAALVAPVCLLALSGGALEAQFGAIGLSGVRGQRFTNEDLLFFEPQNGDHFGRVLATGDFNGDGADDLATGIPHDDGIVGFEITNCGAVVVRYGAPGSGLETGLADTFLSQIGASPDPAESGDNFGSALAACDFNGDGKDDLAVGVPNEAFDDETDPGAVHVYYGSDSGLDPSAAQFLAQHTPGIPGDSEVVDNFGFSLACGHFDGDAFADLAIGVPGESFDLVIPGFVLFAGTVSIVNGAAGGLVPETAVGVDQDTPGVDGDVEDLDRFGWCLAAGDFDGDGFDDLAVGIPGEDGPGVQGTDADGRGAVQILFGSAGGMTTEDVLRTDDSLGGTSENGDRLGFSLAAGDFDGDGFDDLLVGVPFEDLGSAPDAGRLVALYGAASGFDFDRTEDWFEELIHGGGASEPGDLFGFALATGDFDGDGRDDIAIGEPGEFVAVAQDGMVTVIMGSSGGITAARRHGLTAGRDGNPGVANQSNRNHGFAVATGDFDGDGHADIAIGASNENESALVDVGAEVVLYGSLFSNGFDNGDPGFWSGAVP